jgi:glycine/D-amino acid oxidase-like deaminating enzyme
MNSKELPFLIVGQGIAGSLVAWFLEKRKLPYLIIDNNHGQSSSKIAAGIINPITGRRFVKSWMIETFLPFAKGTYLEIQKELGIDVWRDLDIIRFFQNNAEGNNWLAKTTWEGYDAFLNKEKKIGTIAAAIHHAHGYGIVKGAKADLGIIVKAFQNYFRTKNVLVEEEFDYDAIKFETNQLQYKSIKARQIIFCEGFSSYKNPFFDHLPYEAAKGEALILKIPQLKTKSILKKHFFIVPLENNLFWFGSNYEWDDLTNLPTQKGRLFLESELKNILNYDYTIIDHIAAVRPVIKDRRPVIGTSENQPLVAIFNGLGAKGTSIAPYWANELVDFLILNKELPNMVNVKRFSKLLLK